MTIGMAYVAANETLDARAPILVAERHVTKLQTLDLVAGLLRKIAMER